MSSQRERPKIPFVMTVLLIFGGCSGPSASVSIIDHGLRPEPLARVLSECREGVLPGQIGLVGASWAEQLCAYSCCLEADEWEHFAGRRISLKSGSTAWQKTGIQLVPTPQRWIVLARLLSGGKSEPSDLPLHASHVAVGSLLQIRVGQKMTDAHILTWETLATGEVELRRNPSLRADIGDIQALILPVDIGSESGENIRNRGYAVKTVSKLAREDVSDTETVCPSMWACNASGQASGLVTPGVIVNSDMTRREIEQFVRKSLVNHRPWYAFYGRRVLTDDSALARGLSGVPPAIEEVSVDGDCRFRFHIDTLTEPQIEFYVSEHMPSGKTFSYSVTEFWLKVRCELSAGEAQASTQWQGAIPVRAASTAAFPRTIGTVTYVNK